jgi:hypothetical protein
MPAPFSRASTTSLFALSTAPLPIGQPCARKSGVPGQVTAARLPKATCLSDTGLAPRTLQTARMKIFLQPLFGEPIIRNIKKWKVHTASLSPQLIAVNRLHFV